MDIQTQSPPADEYAALHDEIKRLEKRQAELRVLLLSDPASRTGNAHLIEVRNVTSQRPDYTELRNMYPKIVAEFTFPRTVEVIDVFDVDPETGEIIRHKRTGK